MNRLKDTVSSIHLLAAAAPAVLTAITVSTTEDIIRGVIAIAVIGAVLYQVVVGKQTPDPWLQLMASGLIGYYFGLASKGFIAVQDTAKKIIQESADKKKRGG